MPLDFLNAVRTILAAVLLYSLLRSLFVARYFWFTSTLAFHVLHWLIAPFGSEPWFLVVDSLALLTLTAACWEAICRKTEFLEHETIRQITIAGAILGFAILLSWQVYMEGSSLADYNRLRVLVRASLAVGMFAGIVAAELANVIATDEVIRVHCWLMTVWIWAKLLAGLLYDGSMASWELLAALHRTATIVLMVVWLAVFAPLRTRRKGL